MATLAATGPNAQQIQYWNETAGPRWVRHQALLDLQIRGVGLLTMDRAGIRAGERVLDVGCGCGDTSLELGRRVGRSGSVLGIDVSTVMLEQARAAARAAAQISFENADAQTNAFAAASFDLLFSRFGVMFFIDPVAAFTNLARALRPAGRIAFVCWRDIRENPWILVPLGAVVQLVTLPAPPAPGAPGPFSLADADRLRHILTTAGFTDVDIAAHDETLTVGGGRDLDQAVEFLLELGPMGAALRDADPSLLPKVAAAVREAIRPFHTTDAGVCLQGGVWIVTGRRV